MNPVTAFPAPAVTADAALPLLGAVDPPTVAWREGAAVSWQRYVADVHALAERLPAGRYVLNACECRYRFLVAYGAALARGQTNLLPHNRTGHVLQRIIADYGQAEILDDEAVRAAIAKAPLGATAMPMIGPDHIAAIVFTSGSTGEPTPHWKRWGSLVAGARLVQARYGIAPAPDRVLIATVAPQHMFGLEASVMLPLVSGIAVHAGRPFFPADLLKALEQSPQRHVLVTTPYHLGVLLNAGLSWPQIDLIISATAPLTQDLAARAEQAFGAKVMEIYGSTESGAIASRATATEEHWTLYEGLRLTNLASLHYVEGGHLGQRMTLNDRIEIAEGNRFALLGRDQDLIKVAGKRVSLGDLNHALAEIPGVVEGTFFAPDPDVGGSQRLTAFVVAPGVSADTIQRGLSQCIDLAFMPRPLHLVDALPRNETGKVLRKDLQALAARLGSKA